MAEKDYVVPELKVEVQNCTFKMKDLLEVMKEWVSLNRYYIKEDEYRESKEGDRKTVNISWEVNREVDDYTKLQIKVKFKMTGKNVAIKKKGVSVKGDIKLILEGIMVTDRENVWEKTAGLKFLRDIYDTTFQKSKMDNYRNKLENECNALYNEIKAFFDLHVKN
ncbi:MAG: hypothetical protein HYS32_03105 [Candidatus Woesearchaeota archaeon]|nr:MAG: hypothetical protein HYS32_03105 [Candidatus Woesearchaeota archaeon]